MNVKYAYHNLLLALLMVLFGPLWAQDREENFLDDYLKIAAENNAKLKSTFNEYQAELTKIPQAKGLPDPKVAFNYFIRPVETRLGPQQAGISINQAFPWFGQLGAQENIYAEAAKSKFELFRERRNRLFYEVRSVYYEFYVLESAVRITQENIEILESFKSLANSKLESAIGSAVDVLRIEMELETLKVQLEYLQDSRKPILSKFYELLNTENETSIKIPQTLETEKLVQKKDILHDSLIAGNPQLKEFDFEMSSLDAQIKVANKEGLPKFQIGLSYVSIGERKDMYIQDNGRDAWIFPQVSMSIPIYRKKYSSGIKEKEFMKTAVLLKKQDRINELETKLEGALRDYLDSERRVSLNENLINLAEQSLNILIIEYTSAGTDFEEVLRMERKLLHYELELERARADQNTAVAYINYITGKEY